MAFSRCQATEELLALRAARDRSRCSMPNPLRPSTPCRRRSPLSPMPGFLLWLVAVGLLTTPAWADEEEQPAVVDSNTPWEEKAKLKEESTAKQVALAVPRAIGWPFAQVA